MPFLRVIRDKRGYETTYLMQWYREGHRQRSRILYVFRTPGGVRVGRHPLEPEVLRQLELEHPDIAFDWSVVRENQQVIESPPIDTRRRRPAREESEAVPIAAPAPAPVPIAQTAVAQPPVSPPPRPPSIPAAIEGGTAEEQVVFLAQWYPIVCERIALRSSDPNRQEALLTLAARLNPAGWADAAAITAGLLQATEALERLSQVFAKRRRRPRRRPDAGSTDSVEPTPSES